MTKVKQEPKDNKQYTLKPIQAQMIKVLQDNYFNSLSNFLSFLALENWGYTVTPNTRFAVNEDNNVTITEVEAEPEEKTEVAVA